MSSSQIATPLLYIKTLFISPLCRKVIADLRIRDTRVLQIEGLLDFDVSSYMSRSVTDVLVATYKEKK